MTVEELTKLAMQEMQVIAANVTPSTEEHALGLKRLNTLIASLQNDMVFLAYQDVQSITTVIGQTEYVTKIGTYRVRGFSDGDVNIMSRKDYDQFNYATNGRTNVFVEYNYNPPIIQFAVEPTEAAEFEYRRDVLVTDMVSGQNITLKNNAIEMLILGLAYKLCPAYGVEVARRDSIKSDYMDELNKYRQAQTFRVGDEIVTPVGVEIV